MNFKINKISTLNQKMKTSKTPSLSWQNKLISTALASVSLILGTPQLAVATLPSTAPTNLTIAGSATATYGTGASAGTTGVLAINAGSSANTVLNWVNFSDNTTNGGLLSAADTITFSSTAAGGGAFLNNITGQSPTVLGGTLTSTGKLFFLNPNGIVVGGSSVINAAGFYASTVPDSAAITNFLQYGSMSVFSAGQAWASTLTPTATQVSGIVYVQAGAQITVPVGTGIVGLASGYTGTGVVITGAPSGSFSTVNALTSGNTTAAAWTITNGTSDGGVGVDGIGIGGPLNVNGALQLITLGGNVTTNGNVTVSSGVVAGSIAATGGNLTATTAGGYLKSTGVLTAGGTVTINTVGSTGAGGAVTIASIQAPGTTASSTQTINAGAASLASAGAVTVTTGDFSNLTSVSGSNVNITEVPTGTGVTGRTFGTIASNGTARITETGDATLTVSTLTATGTVTVSTAGDITISSLNSGGALAVSSSAGTVTLGNTSTTSYYNSQTSGGTTTITSPNGIIVNKLTQSLAGADNISTTNSVLGGYGSITLTNVTTNGVTTISTTNNNITLSAVTDAAYYDSGLSSQFAVSTSNGKITISGAVTTNGITSIATSGNAGVNNISGAGLITDLAPSSASTLTISTSATTNANMALAGNAISLTGGITSANSAVTITANNGGILTSGASSIGGALTVTTSNGNISVSNVTMSQTSGSLSNGTTLLTNNGVILSTSTPNSTIYWSGTGQVAFTSVNNGSTWLTASGASYAALPTANNSTASTTLLSTGNMAISGSIVAQIVDIETTAGNLEFLTGGVDSTLNASSKITLKSGNDLYTSQGSGVTFLASGKGVGVNQGPAASITLISATGNVFLNSVVTGNLGTPNFSPNIGYTLTASGSNGNVTINQGYSYLTTNGITITSGNTITDLNDIRNLGANTSSTANVVVSGLTVNLTGNNIIPYLSVNSPAGSVTTITTNNYGSTTLTATNDLGALNLYTNAPVIIGASASDSVKVTGNLTISTINSASTAGAVTTVATAANLAGNIQVTTNNSSVALGTATSSSATLGLVNVTSGSGAITVTTSAAVNTGTISSTGGTTVTSGGNVNLGATTGGATVTAGGNITNTSGTLAGTYTLSAGSSAAPGTISLGGAGTNGVADASTINLANASSVTVNAARGTTVNTLGQNLTTATLNSGYAAGTGVVTLNVTNGSVGAVTISTLSGVASLLTTNAPVATAAISTNTGGVVIAASGNNNVPTFTSLALNNFATASSITGNGNLTVSNITSNFGSNSSGSATLTLNAGASNATATTAVSGTGTLTLGSGIVLSGNQNLVLTTGNADGSIGTITETAGSPVSVYAGTTTFIGNKIIMNLNPTTDSLSTVNFTSNGTVAYAEGVAIKLGTVSMGSGATSGSWTSTTGNIIQSAGIITTTANTTPLTFVGSGVLGGVMLDKANSIAAGPSEIITITATGNSAITNIKPILLGNVTVYNGGGTTTTNYNAASFKVTVSGSATGVANSISQAPNTSVWVWGNTTLDGGAATNGAINIGNAGNNFGALTVTSGSSTTANNVTIHETATSAYSSVTANQFTAISDLGNIALYSSNTAITTGVNGGNTTLTAVNGGVNLAGTASSSTYGTGVVTINAGANSSISSISNLFQIGSGTSVIGNLSITDPTLGATIADQSGSSSLNVTGILSLLAASGNLQLTAANNTVGGLVTQAAYADNIFIQGNLNLVAGSYAPGSANYTATGSITSTGASTFGYLNLTSQTGNVVLSTQTSVLNQLTVIARSGSVDLSGLSLSVDLHVGNGGVGLAPIVTANSYKAPNN